MAPRAAATRGVRTRRAARCAAAADTKTGVARNANIAKLQAGYLFPEIAKRRNAHQAANPDAKVISLGIGDTTEPIPAPITDAMVAASQGLNTLEGYSGYGAEAGKLPLREALVETFYKGVMEPDEVFVSDGSKCDISRFQLMFGPGKSVAVQDPSYPAYVDTSVMMGQTGEFNDTNGQFNDIYYMSCLPENNFFPDLSKAPKTDIIFFCNPNNPTGACATREQLTELVNFALKNGSIIIYDAAYAIFIEDDVPLSIFEIPGAKDCCIETCSFSKYAGFTGVRLGWTVVPKQLKFADGFPVINDWNRVMSTCFNGASNVAQAGGMGCLTAEGFQAMQGLVGYYKENCKIIKDTFVKMGFEVHGGTNAPYVWVGFDGRPSWDVFAEILEKCDLVTTPGSGFGPAGEGFVRVSAFGHREDVKEACQRLEAVYGK